MFEVIQNWSTRDGEHAVVVGSYADQTTAQAVCNKLNDVAKSYRFHTSAYTVRETSPQPQQSA